MKSSIYAVVALIGLAGGAYAGTAAGQLAAAGTAAGGVSQENRYSEELPAPVNPGRQFDADKATKAYQRLSEAYKKGRNPGGLGAVTEAQGNLEFLYAETVTVDVSGQEGIVGHGVGRLSVEYILPQGLSLDTEGSYKVRYYFPGGGPEYTGTIKVVENAGDITAARARLTGDGIVLILTFRKSGGALVAQFSTTKDGRDREEGYIGLTGNSLIVKAETSKIKALAEEVFYGRDLSSQVGEADEAGNINGEALVWHRTKGWVTVKKYPLEGIPDSPQAIESAKDYVIAQVEKETSFKITRSEEGLCGGAGPSYMVDIAIKGVPGSIKTYGILASELASGAPGLMASDECRE